MRISDYINGFEDLITNTRNYIFHHAETGYREYKTAKYLEDIFRALATRFAGRMVSPAFTPWLTRAERVLRY